jgi:integrase
MASIVTRVRQDGTRSHHVKYRDGNGHVRWEHVPGDKRAANARRRKVEDELHRSGGRWVPPAPVKVGEYADRWLNDHVKHRVSPRVFENYERTFRLVLKPAYGQLELAALTYSLVERLAEQMLDDGKAHNTVRNNITPIRSMLAHAVKHGLIVSNPATSLEIAQGRRRKVVPPTRDQIARLFEHVRPDAEGPIVVAAATGLRRGELFALRWADVDFEKATISVHATNHAGHITETTKTEAGERFVPLFESARRELAARKARTRYGRPQDFVFGTAIGTATEPGNFVRREYKPALDRAGLPSFRFHDLRHFAVSALIAQGADIKLLQAIAGHSSATVTLDVYGHLMTDRISEAAAHFDALHPPKIDPEGRREGLLRQVERRNGNHARRSEPDQRRRRQPALPGHLRRHTATCGRPPEDDPAHDLVGQPPGSVQEPDATDRQLRQPHYVPSLDSWAAKSFDYGASWTAQTRVSDVSSNPNYEQFDNRQVPFAGDYLYISSVGDFSYGVWTDWRNTRSGTDLREAPEDDDAGSADVYQCRSIVTVPATKKAPATKAVTADQCPHAGGLDQNIYGDKTP